MVAVYYEHDQTKIATSQEWEALTRLAKFRPPCALCGYFPASSPSSTPMLRKMLKDDTSSSSEYADFFSCIGITHDSHLRVLLGMDEDLRNGFLACFVPARLSHFGLVDLTETIQDFVRDHPWFPVSMELIPEKKEAFEAFLSRRDTCATLVAKSLRFTEDECAIFTAQIRDRGAWYLDRHRGFEDQNKEQINALVQEIAEKHQIFQRYEHAWPVRVLLKRILATPWTDEASYVCRRFGAYDFPPTQHVHKCPRLTQYFAYDGPQSVSPQAKKLLSFLNMEDELTPALYFLGIKTDEHFEMAREMSAGRKRQLLLQGGEDVRGLQLTPFQAAVLSMLLESER
ncbi:hypothetical protein C8R43DRAFT_1122283 [Mycena crocata]|nr:hypothetical protein C8R43DRAFT_1122283 [Mycena crocata]